MQTCHNGHCHDFKLKIIKRYVHSSINIYTCIYKLPTLPHLRPPLVHGHVRRTTIGRVNLAPLDLAESNSRSLLDLANNLGVTLSSIARSGFSSIEPRHEPTLVPPDGERKNHTTAERTAHTLQSAERVELRSAALCVAVRLVHGDVDRGVLDNDAVLDVLAHDSLQHTVLGRELGDNGEGLGGVDLESSAVEGLVVAVEVGIVAAADLVAKSCRAALVAGASEETVLTARVGCDLVGAGVSLPDIHLVTADTLALNVALERRSVKTRNGDYISLQRRRPRG
jgi:hypothetical protein